MVQIDGFVQPDEFWGPLGAARLQWTKPFTAVTDHDLTEHRYRWFPDGELNAAGRKKFIWKFF